MASYSGLYDGVYGTPHALLSSSVKTGNAETALGRVFGKRPYGRAKLRELIVELVGAAAGQAALASHKRVQASTPVEGVFGGGLVPIETYKSVDRVTAAGDVTVIENALQLSSQPSTYVADASGNGGGAKLGY